MGTILLNSGNSFDLLSPDAASLTIDDIAHGLSMICRFGGHCSRFYSVAQHSVLVSMQTSPGNAYAALMHDAAEAIIGDMPRPLKKLLPDYQALEARVEAAVFDRFGVPQPIPTEVWDADLLMCATEQHRLMPDRGGRPYAGGRTPLGIPLYYMPPEEAKAYFLARYAELTGRSTTEELGDRRLAALEARHWALVAEIDVLLAEAALKRGAPDNY